MGQKIIDLRKKKLSARSRASTRPLSFRETPGKRPSLRAQRRRVRAIVALGVFTVFVALAAGVSTLSYLPGVSVQEVHIRGAEVLRPEVVRAYAEIKVFDFPEAYAFLSASNIFLYPREEIERAIVEYFPRVRSAKVSRDSALATAIIVTLEERINFARWCFGVECFFLDRDGFVFAPYATGTQSVSPYTFRGGMAATTSAIGEQYLLGNFASVLALLERMEQAGFSPREVIAEGSQDFSVILSEGFDIRASHGADVGMLIRNLELVLSAEPLEGRAQQLEYIDLRFGNRVYYKLENGEQRTANGVQ